MESSVSGEPGILPIQIRGARPEEAALLSDICFRSKAYWGYDDTFMQAARHELTLTPVDILASHVFVAEHDAVPYGFYRLKHREAIAWLEDLFLDPPAIGRGIGRQLWQHAMALAVQLGCEAVELESDPFAEPFYVKMGARRIGQRESTIQAGRMLPLMRYDLICTSGRSSDPANPASGRTGRVGKNRERAR
jgi:GNAT superfamily N-acetyltransferase